MRFLRRIYISVTRNKARSIIMLLLVVLLGSVSASAIYINQAILNSNRNLLSKLPPITSVQVDIDEWSRVFNDSPTSPILTLPTNMIRNIAALPYVRDFDFFTHIELYGIDVDLVGSGSSQVVQGNEGSDNRFEMKGVHNPNIHDIQEGFIELVAGRTFVQEEMDHNSNVIMISEELARVNNLAIGAPISLRNIVKDWQASFDTGETVILADEFYTVTVVGIFRPILTEATVDILDVLHNRIYAPNSFVETANRFYHTILNEHTDGPNTHELQMTNFHNVFVLYSSTDLPAFREAALELVPVQFRVVDASNPFQDIASSMEAMVDIADLILIITSIAAVISLSLFIFLYVSERKREFGIYLSVGEKKSRILLLLSSEVITIALLGIIIALVVGQLTANHISHQMLIDNLISTQEVNVFSGFAPSDPLLALGMEHAMELEQLIQNYRIDFDLTTLLTFFGIGIGTAILSTIAPMLYVLRLNPKKIMM